MLNRYNLDKNGVPDRLYEMNYYLLLHFLTASFHHYNFP